jgi:hypothetical protein
VNAASAPPVVDVGHVALAADVAKVPPHELRDVGGAFAPEIETRVRFAATPEAFVVLFEAKAEPPLTLARRSGEDVFRDECVELYLSAPGKPTSYREIVVNARGAVYAALVENPDDRRETWTVVAGDPPAGTFVEVDGDPATGSPAAWVRWRCLLAVPWASLPSGRPPAPGEERRGNAFRIARGRSTRFLALSPTFRSSPPDFHVPSRFALFAF